MPSFERKLAEFLDVRWAVTTNSGSSANLLAHCRADLAQAGRAGAGARAMRSSPWPPAFPTTVNPAVQYGLIPVFVDVDIPTYNIQADKIEAAITAKTRAIMVAHTLGNPFNLAEVMRIAKKHDLWLIEDCCDALGLALQRPARRHLRRHRDPQLLSGPPHHHGRGRRRVLQRQPAQGAGRVVPRLGTRLLVRSRQGQHLRQAIPVAARRSALRLRPQVRLLAHRLQPEDHRLPGRRRTGATGARRRLHRAAPRQLRLSPRAAEALRGVPDPARGDAELRALVVRISRSPCGPRRRSPAWNC